MVKISDNISVGIPEIENIAGLLFKTLWVEYGVSGILPRIVLELNGYSDNLSLKDVTVSLIINGKIIINSPGVIDSVTKSEGVLKFQIYLVKSINFLRNRTTNCYKSIREVVNSLWIGNIELDIPNQENLYLCQLNEINHEYLTKALTCSSAEQSFCYNLLNSIVPVELTNRKIDYDLSEKSDIVISAKDRGVELARTNADYIEEYTGIINGKYITTGGYVTYFSDNETYQLEENYVRTRLCLEKIPASFIIEYTDPEKLSVGKVVKVQMNNSKVNLLIISVKMYLDVTGLRVSALAYKYN